MDKLSVFFRLAKVDAAQRVVYGVAADESVDAVKEIFDYKTSKPFFEKWSGKIEKATDGKSLGNVRAMHGKVAAGKLEQINFDDDTQQIGIAAKIVDDNEWAKVEDGVYTGFSVGGSYVKKWKDGDATRYTCNPCEISLVDLPCIPTAMFTAVKADGGELRKYFQPGSEAVDAKIEELAKAAGKDPVADRAEFEAPAREALAKDAQAPAPVVEVADETPEPTNEAVVAKASEIAKAKGGSWTTYVEEARLALVEAARAPAGEPAEKAAGAAAAAQEAAAAPGKAGDRDIGAEQVWCHKRIPGKTFGKKADLVSALDALDAAEKAATLAAPATDALKGLQAKVPAQEPSDAEKAAADAAAKAAADAAPAPLAGEVLAAAVKAGECLADGKLLIKTAEDATAAIAAYKPEDGRLARRHIIKRARALKVALPEDWSQAPKVDKAMAAEDLKKSVSLYSLSSLLDCLARLEMYEESCECDSPYYDSINLPNEIKTRFGSLVVELGDIIAAMLDVILSTMRTEEAGEAMTRALAAADVLKGLVGGQLEKVVATGAAAEPADVVALTATIEAERTAFKTTIADLAKQITAVTNRLKVVESAPLPPGTSSVTPALKVAEKGGDTADAAATMATAEDMLRDPAVLGKLADAAFRVAHARPIHAMPGVTPR